MDSRKLVYAVVLLAGAALLYSVRDKKRHDKLSLDIYHPGISPHEHVDLRMEWSGVKEEEAELREDATPFERHPQQTNSSSHICNSAIRIKLLRDTCHELGLTNATIPWDELAGRHWIVDDLHKIFYCLVPKAASHSLRQLLARPIIGQLNASVLYPMENYMDATGFRYLHNIPENERRLVLRDYYKMIVVRHPLDRLRSAYMNKMKVPGGLNEQVLDANIPIINAYLRSKKRLNDTSSFDPMTDIITFDQFLELVSTNSQFSDEHWLSMYDTCQPCAVRYDVMMRVETLDNDVTDLYPHLGSGDTNSLTRENMNLAEDVDEKLNIVGEVFRKIHPKIINDIVKKYERDFKMFGYHWGSKQRATCGVSEDVSIKSCC